MTLLSPVEIAEILEAEPLKRPSKTGIKARAKYLLRAKIGGEMQTVTVICRCEPYQKRLGNGGTAWYVDVYGWGIRKSVNIKKLREKPQAKRLKDKLKASAK